MNVLAVALSAALALQPALVLAADPPRAAPAAAPAKAKAGVAMPKSPLTDKEFKDTLKALGPTGTKLKIPTFKKNATAKQKAAKLRRIDRLVALVKANKTTPPHLQSGVRVWESLNSAQKEALVSSDAFVDPTVTGWVGVVVAVVALAYYVADTQNWVSTAPADKAEEPAPTDDGGDAGAGDDGGDGGDTGIFTLDY